jgi:hypothetical protein
LHLMAALNQEGGIFFGAYTPAFPVLPSDRQISQHPRRRAMVSRVDTE